MKGFGGGMQNLMRQANQMQIKMKKLQEELATREFEGTAGGDGVVATVTGGMKVKSISVKPDVFEAGDIEMLQDLVTAAVNTALQTAKETSDKEMSKVTGGMNFPGM